MENTDKIINWEEEKNFDYGYLICYLPFRTKLKKCSEDEYKQYYGNNENDAELNTRAVLRSVKGKINEHVRFYHVYQNMIDYEHDKTIRKTYVPKPEEKREKKSKENPGKESEEKLEDLEGYVKRVEGIFKEHLKDKTNREDFDIRISDISFSLYDERNYLNIGMLKVTIVVQFKGTFSEEEKGGMLSYIYDVISRNTKTKFDKPETEFMRFNTKGESFYSDLVKLFNGMPIKWIKKRWYESQYRTLSMNELDWAFNYDDKDRKCYTFAYYTVKDEINHYNRNNSKDLVRQRMYHIARIHENGAIRTYNRNNDIFDMYMDDTSVIWGVSRVGLGAILVQEENIEKFRNIRVLNEDFSFLYEFCLHQKFFSFSLIDYERRGGEKTQENCIFKRIWRFLMQQHVGQYLLRRTEFTSFNEIFCPRIVSEFETQDVYDLIRKNLEVERLMNDAKNTLNYLEADKMKKVNARNTWISAIISTLVFPLTVSEYIKRYLSANETFSMAADDLSFNRIFLVLFGFGLIVWLAQYLLTNRYKK